MLMYAVCFAADCIVYRIQTHDEVSASGAIDHKVTQGALCICHACQGQRGSPDKVNMSSELGQLLTGLEGTAPSCLSILEKAGGRRRRRRVYSQHRF